jgi:protoheme IX farnesyltransferase
MIKKYLSLVKPGIILGNSITASAGFFLASQGTIQWSLFVFMLLGLACIIGSGCTFNNYLDQSFDGKMKRTMFRPLVQKTLSGKKAILFGSVLGVLGVFLLACTTNLLTVCIAVGGFLVYVVLYTLLKPRSVYGTLLGSIAGAVPPIVGFTAVQDHVSLPAILLFLIVVLWQMPHFYAIALYRIDEYEAASIPVHPIKKGIVNTKNHMLFYIIGYIAVSSLLTFLGYAGPAYLLITTAIGFIWLYLCFQGFKTHNNQIWARKMFIASLVAITVQSIILSLDVLKS